MLALYRSVSPRGGTQVMLVYMPLGSAWSSGAAGVHGCGILRRVEWWWDVVSYG